MEPLELEIARALERLESRVWTDAVRAATPDVVRALGLSVEPVGDGIALIASRLPHVLYNRAFGFGLDAPIDEAMLDQALAHYPIGTPFSIQPSKMARPPEIADWIDRRGIDAWFHWVIWQRDARAPLTTLAGPRIERIGLEHAAIWSGLATRIFADEGPIGDWIQCLIGRERWRHYLAYDGERPIGIGALYVEDAFGWLGWGGTLAEYRRRGVQTAMIARRIRDAAAEGVLWLRSETAPDSPEKPNASYHNMARAGFRVSHRRPSYAVMRAATAPRARR